MLLMLYPSYDDNIITFTANLCGLSSKSLNLDDKQIEDILCSELVSDIYGEKGSPLLLQSSPVLTLNLLSAEEGFSWLRDVLSKEEIQQGIEKFESYRFPPNPASWAGTVLGHYIIKYSTSFPEALALVPFKILLLSFPLYHTRSFDAAITDLFVRGEFQ